MNDVYFRKALHQVIVAIHAPWRGLPRVFPYLSGSLGQPSIGRSSGLRYMDWRRANGHALRVMTAGRRGRRYPPLFTNSAHAAAIAQRRRGIY